jgi:threonine aldolase
LLRKRLGGGMRQSGFLAAAGSYALDHHVGRLADDHRRARWIGAAVGCAPETNIVLVELDGALDGPQVAAAAREQGVLVSVGGPRMIRAVTHLDVDDIGARHAAEVLAALVTA